MGEYENFFFKPKRGKKRRKKWEKEGIFTALKGINNILVKRGKGQKYHIFGQYAPLT